MIEHPIIARMAIILALAISVAVILILQRQSKHRVVIHPIPSWKNAEIIGDGAWLTKPAQWPKDSALIRDIEPRGM